MCKQINSRKHYQYFFTNTLSTYCSNLFAPFELYTLSSIVCSALYSVCLSTVGSVAANMEYGWGKWLIFEDPKGLDINEIKNSVAY